MSKNEDRRMPVEETWFDYHNNDILYAILQCFADKYWDVKEQQFAVSLDKQILKENLPYIRTLLGNKTTQTINRKIRRWITEGYIEEKNNIYFFPYDPTKPYCLVDKDLLKFLCNTMSQFIIKIYVYLANKVQFVNEHYQFSVTELIQAFGYAPTTRISTQLREGINDSLALLNKSEILTWKIVSKDLGGGKKTYYKEVISVAKTIPKDLQTAKTQKKKYVSK